MIGAGLSDKMAARLRLLSGREVNDSEKTAL